MKPRATGRLTIPIANRRAADFPQDAGPAGPGCGGQVGRPSVEALVDQDGEGDGFFRVAVDAVLDQKLLEILSLYSVDHSFGMLNLFHNPTEFRRLSKNHALHGSVIPFNCCA